LACKSESNEDFASATAPPLLHSFHPIHLGSHDFFRLRHDTREYFCWTALPQWYKVCLNRRRIWLSKPTTPLISLPFPDHQLKCSPPSPSPSILSLSLSIWARSLQSPRLERVRTRSIPERTLYHFTASVSCCLSRTR
jgi:hypothetical protein